MIAEYPGNRGMKTVKLKIPNQKGEAMTARTNGERLAVIEEQIKCLCKKTDSLENAINGLGMRFDSIRRGTAGRIWSVVSPILSAITMGILALLYAHGKF